jgi:hypothetical protein
MTAGEYQEWMEKAFLVVEAALSMELATPSRVCMTEDYFRSALVRGLSYSEPSRAGLIATEEDATWTGQNCWQNAGHGAPGQGRPIQHDVAVRPNQDDAGLICEVKWLKQAKAVEVGKDIWKLALSRSTTAEGTALRTYLLLGGESDPFSRTLSSLRGNRVDLRWSRAGRQGGQLPGPRPVPLLPFLQTTLGRKALSSLLSWGTRPNRHHREPPACWATMMIALRNVWGRRVPGGVAWRAALWELHHWGAPNNSQMDWPTIRNTFPFTCPP